MVKILGCVPTSESSGLVGKYFPYGQERPSATTNGKEKFATYFRDSETGLDYANQRYHQPGMGRFMTPDRKSGNGKVPGSWNSYAYTGGDPVNRTDPTGNDWVYNAYGWCSTLDPSNWCYQGQGWGSTCDEMGLYGGNCSPDDSGDDTGGGGDGGCFANSLYGGGGCFGPDPTPDPPEPPPAPAPPDCNAITAAVGFSGLTYSNALEIWNDGGLSTYKDDATAATIGAIAAVTWQGESGFGLNPLNNANTNKAGRITSVDHGPFQINDSVFPNAGTAVLGTSGPGQRFNGNPDANISFGINLLKTLYGRFGDNAAGRYVGALNRPGPQKREATWMSWKGPLTALFSNTDCFPHQ